MRQSPDDYTKVRLYSPPQSRTMNTSMNFEITVLLKPFIRHVARTGAAYGGQPP